MDKKYVGMIVILLALAALALGLFFLWQGGLEEQELPDAPEVLGDTTPPVTVVFSPEDTSWHRTGFIATIMDSDLGSGFPEQPLCQYIIQDLGTREAIGGFRPCDEVQIFVPVGEGRACSSSFEADSSSGRCLLSTKAVDRAGNESPWNSALFLIDTTRPAVSISSLPAIVQPAEEQTIEAIVTDNGKVTRCDFFVDGTALKVPVSLSPLPCSEGVSCTLSLTHTFVEPGNYKGGFACSDAAGNAGFGETTSFRVFVNEPPTISSCKVSPTQGTNSTSFQFEVTATDIDGDELSYAWNFGDGNTLELPSPAHGYESPGTYMPKVQVKDPSGEAASCETAWVVVQ